MIDIWTTIGQYGIPAGLTIYLVYWLTQRVEKILDKLQAAIDNQTTTLNHTLTKLITRQATKEDINQLLKNNRRKKHE